MGCGTPVPKKTVPVLNHTACKIMKSHWDLETLKWTKSSRNCVSDLIGHSFPLKKDLFKVFTGKLYPNLKTTFSHQLTFHAISSFINSYQYSLIVNGIFL